MCREKYEYCNVGYFTLAEIIRKVSGKSWGEFLNERIFAPLEMTATRTTSVTDLVSKRADGYVWTNGKLQNASEFIALRPSGAFLSTVVDLAKWDAALNTGKIWSRSSIRFNVDTGPSDGTPLRLRLAVEHGEGWTQACASWRIASRFSCSGSARFLDDKLTVIVLTNGDNADAESIALGLANHYIPGLIRKRVVAKYRSKDYGQLRRTISGGVIGFYGHA